MKDEFLGDKIRAGRILSESLRKIMQEQTEFVVDPDTKEFRMCTKAEALMRLWVKHALGFEEEIEVTLDGGGRGTKKVVHLPDRVYGQLIADRIEGRVATVVENDSKHTTVAKKVSDMNKRRINKLSKDATD